MPTPAQPNSGPPGAAAAWDSPGAGPAGQGLLLVPGLLGLGAGALDSGLRVFPPNDGFPVLVASFIAYGVVATAVGLIVLTVAWYRSHRPVAVGVLTALTVALLVLQISWQLPLYVPDGRVARTKPFTLLSINMRASESDPAELMTQARQADVLVLLESTPNALRLLQRAGLDEQFGYHAGGATETRNGAAIYSRFPLSEIQPLPPTSFPMWSATTLVPDVGPVRVVTAHPCNPFCGPGKWPGEHAVLREFVRSQRAHPLVVAGDFNAVNDHGPMRRLRAAGLRSATEIAGAGWLPTYPAGSVLPPLIPIDHVLLNEQLTALSITTVEVAGTDHLGLLTTLAGTGTP